MSQKKTEFLFSAAVVLLLGWALWEARDWPAHSRIFPWSIGSTVLLLALIQFIASARRLVTPSRAVDDIVETTSTTDREPLDASSDDMEESSNANRGRALAMCGWILIFFLGIWLLGFRVGSFVLTFVFLKFGASEKWAVSITAGLTSYLFFLLVFQLALQVPLPTGLLAESFGLNSLDDFLVSHLISLH